MTLAWLRCGRCVWRVSSSTYSLPCVLAYTTSITTWSRAGDHIAHAGHPLVGAERRRCAHLPHTASSVSQTTSVGKYLRRRKLGEQAMWLTRFF